MSASPPKADICSAVNPPALHRMRNSHKCLNFQAWASEMSAFPLESDVLRCLSQCPFGAIRRTSNSGKKGLRILRRKSVQYVASRLTTAFCQTFRAVLKHLNFFQGDEAAAHHFFQLGHETFDLRFGINNLNHQLRRRMPFTLSAIICRERNFGSCPPTVDEPIRTQTGTRGGADTGLEQLHRVSSVDV